MCFGNHEAFAVLTSGTEIETRAYANSPVNLRKPSKAASAGERLTSTTTTRTFKEYESSDTTFGVGIELTRHESKNMMVSALLPGASNAPDDLRLLPGDLIESVNGQGVMGMKAKDAMNLTLGKNGTLVTFGILRNKARKFITLTRNVPHTGDGASHEDKLPSSSRSVPQKASTPMSLAATNLFDEALSHSLDASAARRGEAATAIGRQGLSTVRAAGGSTSRERSPVSGEELERERGRAAQYREQLQQAQGQEAKKAKERELELGVLLQHARSDKQDLEREVAKLQRDLADAHRGAGAGASREGNEESTTVGKLEEMVETLLALGEQEASALNSDLRETNAHLKSILGSLLTLEGTLLLSASPAARLSPSRSLPAAGALSTSSSAWPASRWPTAAQPRPSQPARPWPTSTVASSNCSQVLGSSMRSLSEATSALRESFQEPDADREPDAARLDSLHPPQPSPLSHSWSHIRSSFSPSPPVSTLPGDHDRDRDRPFADRHFGTINNAAPLPDPFTAPTPQATHMPDLLRPFPVPGPDASRRYSPLSAPYGEIPGDVVEEIRRLLDRGKTVQQIMKNYKLQGLGLPEAQVQACVDALLSKGLLESRQRGYTPNPAPTPIAHVDPTPTALYRDPGAARPLVGATSLVSANSHGSSFSAPRRRDPSPSSSDQTDNTVATSRLGEDSAYNDVSAYTSRVFASPPPRAGSPPAARVVRASPAPAPTPVPDDDDSDAHQELAGREKSGEWEVSRAWRAPSPATAAVANPTPSSAAPKPNTLADTPALESPRSKKGRWPTPRWSQRTTPPTAAPAGSGQQQPTSSDNDADVDQPEGAVTPVAAAPVPKLRTSGAASPSVSGMARRSASPAPASRRVMDI